LEMFRRDMFAPEKNMWLNIYIEIVFSFAGSEKAEFKNIKFNCEQQSRHI
jgi:hypothetical protein